ncbi:gamma-glutamyltransferase [Subtercola endophyticus]|uniref:gamma-glutamyltransferase n=1 Tax=Subtercola endophyticus TaxID=2895559 RepID=UPI001E64ED29|nr:gamma-glutamyltransferase [Subtercola endophyticus]UFS58664.1 gamma-glutamyltransferase [Subtercola endophyticus]
MTPSPEAQPEPLVTHRRVALAAPHYLATRLGEQVIREGGGAVEAALTAAVALTVVYPHQSSLGGDLVALVRDPAGRVASYISVGRTAQGLDAAAVPRMDDRIAGRGAHTVTVPGVVAGWVAIAGERFAPALARAFERASVLARDGFEVSPGLARALADTWPIVGADAGMRQVFGRAAVGAGGDASAEPLRAGDRLVQPQLADVLELLARDPLSFYTGEVAERVASALAEAGSALTLTDLAQHAVDTSPALSAVADGIRWSVAPPPSQGIAFLAVQSARASAPAVSLVDRSVLELSMLAASVRDARLGDPAWAGGPDALTLDGYLRDMARAAGALDLAVERPSGDTAGITAQDSDGWSVSIVQSVYQTFGSGVCDPGTGIVFHNRGAAFSLEPGHPGALAAGRRPPHTLTPVLGAAPNGDVLALACQGGRAQPWILAQLSADLTDSDIPIETTLARDRFVFGGRDIGEPGPTIAVESADVPDDVREVAERWGWRTHALGEQVDVAGHVQVTRMLGGTLSAGTDPRADGLAVVS